MDDEFDVDPDYQATVNDFSDFTVRLPADIRRSLALIEHLDQVYNAASSEIHRLARIYGNLPNLPESERMDPAEIRAQMSRHLTRAQNARANSYAESVRLRENIHESGRRCAWIVAKLQSLPLPPSRDPSPEPQPTVPDQTQATQNSTSGPPRIRLRFDRTQASQQQGGGDGRIVIPGRIVLVDKPNDFALPDFESDEWESEPDSDSPEPVAQTIVKRPGARRGKQPRRKKAKLEKAPRTPRQPGFGTNVHSAVAGISTSNALALLKPPPEDAVPGSEHAPWLRLTQWEMAKLRKRMKKNAVWKPSETMVRRELASLSRGPENYHAAKAKAEAAGEPFVDAANIAEEMSNPTKRVLAEGEIGVDSLGMEEIQLSNRGMKLNEAKKLKKENMQRELAAQAAAEAELAARRVAELRDEGKANVLKGGEGLGSGTDDEWVASDTAMEDMGGEGSDQEMEDVSEDGHEAEVITAMGKTTITVPLADEDTTMDFGAVTTTTAAEETSSKRPTTRGHASVAAMSKSPDTPLAPFQSRGTATPAEQVRTAGKDRPRRASTISTAPVDTPVSARPVTRQGKRPVPGRLTAESGQGGAAVTVGKRTAAPKKKAAAKRSKSETQDLEGKMDEIDEEGMPVDPNEPKYCVCGDVSYGTMIMCENSDCEKEWFHLACVNLSEVPGRTTKWFCPECRRKLGVGEQGQAARSKKR